MFHEDPETYPFWTETPAEPGPTRIGLGEAFLETVGRDLIGLDFLVTRGELARGDTLVLLHTGEGAVRVIIPFAAEILGVNPAVALNPRLLRQSPYFEGWLAEIRQCP